MSIIKKKNEHQNVLLTCTTYVKFYFRYLGCIELSDLSMAEQAQHAFFLGLAALLGEGIYNLGELVRIY